MKRRQRRNQTTSDRSSPSRRGHHIQPAPDTHQPSWGEPVISDVELAAIVRDLRWDG